MERKKHNSHYESTLQSQCVRWFRYQYPNYLLASIPNGGRRDIRTGAIMKREGAVAGMPDLFLYLVTCGYHGLAIEMKTDKGTQQDSQKEIEKYLVGHGYRYIICRSLEEFVDQVEAYINCDLKTLNEFKHDRN